eukprot:12003840-Alexandrium_andersonii.AAC.1
MKGAHSQAPGAHEHAQAHGKAQGRCMAGALRLKVRAQARARAPCLLCGCLLYTSDAADDM